MKTYEMKSRMKQSNKKMEKHLMDSANPLKQLLWTKMIVIVYQKVNNADWTDQKD